MRGSVRRTGPRYPGATGGLVDALEAGEPAMLGCRGIVPVAAGRATG